MYRGNHFIRSAIVCFWLESLIYLHLSNYYHQLVHYFLNVWYLLCSFLLVLLSFFVNWWFFIVVCFDLLLFILYVSNIDVVLWLLYGLLEICYWYDSLLQSAHLTSIMYKTQQKTHTKMCFLHFLILQFTNLYTLLPFTNYWSSRGDWVAQSVKHLTIGFGSDCDFMCRGISPHVRLGAQWGMFLKILSLPSLCALSCTFSLTL